MWKSTDRMAELKEMAQQVQALEAGGRRFCESCEMPESSPPFMLCKACKETLDRRTFYCSRYNILIRQMLFTMLTNALGNARK